MVISCLQITLCKCLSRIRSMYTCCSPFALLRIEPSFNTSGRKHFLRFHLTLLVYSFNLLTASDYYTVGLFTSHSALFLVPLHSTPSAPFELPAVFHSCLPSRSPGLRLKTLPPQSPFILFILYLFPLLACPPKRSRHLFSLCYGHCTFASAGR